MSTRQGTSALAEAGAAVDPHGWLPQITAAAPLVAVCAVGIVVAVCATIIVLVRSTDQSQRLAAIKALAPALLALSSRLTGWRPPSGKS